MRKIALFLASLILAATVRADDTTSWTMYLSYHNNTSNVPADGLVYSLCDGNLFSYDPADTEVRLLSKLDGLNGTDIALMGYARASATLVLVYSDGNIDLLTSSGQVVNIPQLKNATDGSLTLNDLVINGQWATLATGTSIVLIDVQKQEIKGVFAFDHNYRTACVFDGQLFGAYDATIRHCPLSGNPSDESQWQEAYSTYAQRFVPFAGRLYYTTTSGTMVLSPANTLGGFPLERLDRNYYTTAYADATRLVLSNATTVALVEANSPMQEATYAAPATWTALTRSSDGTLWASEGERGLQAYKLSGGSLTASGYPVGGYGPRRDLCNFMRYEGERLLIAGGYMDPFDVQHYPGTLMAYENGAWTTFQEDGIAEQTGVAYRDMLSIAQDPADAAHHFAASNTGLYEFRNYRFQQYYSYENAPLQSAVRGDKRYIRLDGVLYSPEGDLYVLNSAADTVVWTLRQGSGAWVGIPVEPLKQAPTLERALLDTGGRLWITERRTVSYMQAGVCCLDFGGTPANTADDVVRYRYAATNEDGTTVDLGNPVYALAQDQQDRIWIGSATGCYVVEDPAAWFDADFTLTQPKVPRNDGTNYADYLLSGVPVSAIAVDGADRKWLGTMGSGLYLVSEDGTQILQHFTAASSPLLSDNVQSLAVNLATGEVMVGTDVGLCSYRGDATAPLTTLSLDNLRIYPNPVRTDADSKVTISGLTQDADVKIVTVGGQCVAGGTSTGGTFVWDVTGPGGRRVAPGIYYIQICTADAKKGIVGKVAVI